MNNEENTSGKLISVVRWTVAGILLIFAFVALFKDSSFLTFLSLVLLSGLIIPNLSSRIAVLNNRSLKIILAILLLALAGAGLPKSDDKLDVPQNLVKKSIDSSDQAKDSAVIEDGNKYIKGLDAVDVYLSFQKRGFSLKKEIGVQMSVYTNKSESNGLSYTVETYCENSISEVSSIRLTSMRDFPQYNTLDDMKPFLKFGCSIPYDGANTKKLFQFIDENYSNNKANIVIGGVKFIILVPSEFVRIMLIEKAV